MQNQNNDDTEEKGADWLDFKAIKNNTEVKPVLEHFEILEYLEPKGAELVGWCPLGHEHGKEDSFAFNVEKKTFQCFACKSRGSILDFIAKYQDVTLREAAKIAMKITFDTADGMTQENLPETKKERPYGKPKLPISKPETAKQEKPEKKVKTEANLVHVFTWDQAQSLVTQGMLIPDQLVVLNMDSLELFLKNSAKVQKTD
jgi:hypothetical protein